MEHFTHGPQKLETGKHLTKQVWSRLLEEKRGLLVFSFASLAPLQGLLPPHPPPAFVVCLPLGCVRDYSMS